MRPRCAACGAPLDDDGICPRCELETVPLTDADIGVRRDDRYVALPPGPRWVRRRVHRESSVAPLVALAAALGVLALMVVLAPNDDGGGGGGPDTPVLNEETGVVLLRAGPWGVEEIDLDERRIRSVPPEVMPTSTAPTVDVEDPVLVETGRLSIRWSRCGDERCVIAALGGETVVEVTDPRAATLAPDGATLALLAPERSVLVEITTGTVTPIRDGAVPRDVTAWSPDGEWLFVLTHDGGIDAVAGDGDRFRLPVNPRVTEAIAAR